MHILKELYGALQFSFMQRALIAGSFTALACSLLGIFLVLRRFSLIGDGLAHVSFATVALGLMLNTQPLLISIPLVALASIFILTLSEKVAVYGDAAIGLVSTFCLALGIMIASLSGGFNVDLFSYLFGNILTISNTEVILSILLSLLVIIIVLIYYRKFLSVTFDEEFAKISGIKTKRINRILIILTSFTVVLGIKIVGTLLISSLIILPAVTALQLVSRFKTAIVIASICAISSVVLGVLISYILNLPSGPAIVMVNFLYFTAAFLHHIVKR